MTRRSSNRLARNEERTNLHRSNNLHNVQKGKLLYVHSIVNLMTLIVYVETEECELESFDDDDEDDETADDDEDDCYDDDRANKSIHSNPETDNLTASSLNKQSKTDLSSFAVASDDEHTIISSNGSKDVDDDNDVHNHNNNDGDDDENDNNDNSNGFQPTVSSIPITSTASSSNKHNSNGFQPTVSSIPITSTAPSSNKHRKRKVNDDDDDDDDPQHDVESAVVRASLSNHGRLSGDVSLISIGNLVGSSRKVTFGSTQVVTLGNDYKLTWTEGVKFCNFKFIVPRLGEIKNNFALTSSPNSTLSRDKDNYVSVDACQVYGILMLWLSLATQHLIKRTVVSSLGY